MTKKVLVLSIGLWLVVALGACGGRTQAKEVATPLASEETPAEVAPAAIRGGELSEVHLAAGEIKLGQLNDPELVGDYLYASVPADGETRWMVIEIPEGHTFGDGPAGANASLQPYSVRWQRGAPGERHQMFVYDWHAGQERSMAVEGEPWYPAVDGNTLVWLERRGEQWGLYGYDLAQDRSFSIAPDSGYVSEIRVSGDWVGFVDQEEEGGNAELYVHSIANGQTLHLATIPYWKPYALEKGRAAWVAWKDGDNEIHVYDLGAGQEKVIHRARAGESDCVVSHVDLAGDLAFWSCEESRQGLDLAHDVGFELPLFPPGKVSKGGVLHLLSETRIVWILQSLDDELFHVYTLPILRQ